MKRNTRAIDILKEYICRNSSEQDVPPGYISKDDIKKTLKCSENQFTRIMRQLKKNKMVDVAYIKRLSGSRIYKKPFFKLSGEVKRLIGIK